MIRLKQHFSRFDWGYLAVLILVVLAIWPFLANAGLPQETDAELHIFRLAELSFLVRGGEFYPRWAPNFYHGYGYPIFNYYAPLSYYIGMLFDFLPGVDVVTAVKSTFILGILLGAVGMYGFVRDNWGRPAAYVATAVYLFTPYIQYIDPHARGVLPESFALGIFPMALWTLDRLRRQKTAWRWITAVLFTTAIILSHNLMALLLFAILFAWTIWHIASNKWQTPRPPAPLLLIPALLLAVGLSAFFWLPIALERNAVNLNTLIGAGDNYDFHTHFLSLYEMLRPTALLDWGDTEPLFHFNLGIAQWMLGGLGIVVIVLRRAKNGAHAAFFAIAATVLLLMMLPISAFLWESIPMLPFFQFPWRFLGATAVMLAVLAGIGTEAVLRMVPSPRVVAGITAVFVGFPMLLGLPLTQPAPWPEFGDVFPLRVFLIEHKGRWLGTTSTADYVPATVDAIPGVNGNVVRGFFDGTPLDRVNRLALPAEATVSSDEISPLHFRYETNAPEGFLLRLFLFDFPGWQVEVDGERVETELGLPEGFIVVPVPAGEHTIDVRFGSTSARNLAWAISGVSFLLLLAGAWHFKGKGDDGDDEDKRPFILTDYVVLATVMGITAVTVLFLQPTGVLHYQSTGQIAEPAENSLSADFGEQISIIGYNTSAVTANAGDTIEMTLYEKAQQPLDINYQSFLHVLAADGSLVAQSDHLNPGDFPTRRWPLDKYIRDEHQFTLPPDLPAGEYTVKAGFWVQDEGWRLPLLDESGQQIDDGQILFYLYIEPQ